MNIAMVVLNYNDTNRVFELVKKHMNNYIFNLIVIVDNNSKEDLSILYTLNSSKVKIIKSDVNLWYTGGTNFGLKYLLDYNIDYAFIINSDIDVDESIFLDCINHLINHNDCSIVSTEMIEHGKKELNYYNFPTITYSVFENLGIKRLFKQKIKKKDMGNYFIVPYCRSSFWCIRYSDMVSIDFFDQNVKQYHGETCIGYKLKKIGKNFAILKNKTYIHNHIYSKNYKLSAYKDNYQSLLYVFNKYSKKNKLQKLILKLSFYIGLMLRKLFKVT